MSTNSIAKAVRITGFLKILLTRLALVLGASTAFADEAAQSVKTQVDSHQSDVQTVPYSDGIAQDLKQTMQDGGLYVLLSELQINSEILYRAALDTMALQQMYSVNHALNALLEEQRKANDLLTIIAHKAR